MPKLMKQINIISRCAGLFRSERLKDTDLSACHTSYLFTVCRNPGISQDKLAQAICINRSNVTRQLVYLEEHGYVERRQSENDKRMLLVYPTQRALDALPHLQEIVNEWNIYLTGELSEEELKMLSEMLDSLAERAKAYSGGKGSEK